MDSIQVRISEANGYFGTVEVAEGATVREALEKAGVNTQVNKQLRINMDEASLDSIVHHNDTIYVVPQVKGN